MFVGVLVGETVSVGVSEGIDVAETGGGNGVRVWVEVQVGDFEGVKVGVIDGTSVDEGVFVGPEVDVTVLVELAVAELVGEPVMVAVEVIVSDCEDILPRTVGSNTIEICFSDG